MEWIETTCECLNKLGIGLDGCSYFHSELAYGQPKPSCTLKLEFILIQHPSRGAILWWVQFATKKEITNIKPLNFKPSNYVVAVVLLERFLTIYKFLASFLHPLFPMHAFSPHKIGLLYFLKPNSSFYKASPKNTKLAVIILTLSVYPTYPISTWCILLIIEMQKY